MQVVKLLVAAKAGPGLVSVGLHVARVF